MTRSVHHLESRRGGIAVPALLAFPIVLLALVIALSSRIFLDVRTRMQIEADASALAGAGSLASDAMLRGRYQTGANAAELYALLQFARLEIRAYAQANPVYGDFSIPDWNLTTPADGDIVFGNYDRTLATPFTVVPILDSLSAPEPNLHLINSVRVTMRRTHALGNPIKVPHMPLLGSGKVDVITRATAMLDGDVIGFRPLFADRPISLVPIALDAATVANQITPPYADSLSFSGGAFVPGTDNLPEISVFMTTSTPPMGVTTTAVPLEIGLTNLTDFLNQIMLGIDPAQLAGAPFNGAFILQPDNSTMPGTMKLTVPGSEFFASPDGPSIDSALDVVAPSPGTPRIWPLYSGFDMSGQPIITGFIALRLATVEALTDGMGAVQAIKLTLQPTLKTEPSAVTNPAFRGYVGVPNPTIAKLRLVP